MRKPCTTQEFIEKCKLVHGDVYLYDKTEYFNNSKNVTITCKIHGDFEQRPSHHTSSEHGCKKCGTNKMAEGKRGPKYSTEDFINRATKIHGGRYDYTKSDYKLAINKIEIICKNHGSFWQAPADHLKGQGCPYCYFSILRRRHKSNSIDKKEFLKRAKIAHPNSVYDYSKVECNGTMGKITIICPTHGEFEQRQNTHLSGFGCRACGNGTNVYESKLYDSLKNKFPNEIQTQISPNWLGRQSFDVFIPKLNIAIEYQGEQHLKPVEWFGGKKYFEKILERDRRKYDLCIKNNIELIYFSYKTYKDESLSISPIWHDFELLVDYLTNKLA